MPSDTGYTRAKSGIATPDSGTIPSIASAATLALPVPATSLVYIVTGTTGITAITGLPVGQRTTLIFTGGLTITNSATLRLAGAVNYTVPVNGVVTFVNTGTTIYESGRSAD